MSRVPTEDSAALRARWLAELADALDEARCLVKDLGAGEAGMEAVDLCQRIDSARLLVEAIRLRRAFGGGQHLGPKWTKDIPWRRSA